MIHNNVIIWKKIKDQKIKTFAFPPLKDSSSTLVKYNPVTWIFPKTISFKLIPSGFFFAAWKYRLFCLFIFRGLIEVLSLGRFHLLTEKVGRWCQVFLLLVLKAWVKGKCESGRMMAQQEVKTRVVWTFLPLLFLCLWAHCWRTALLIQQGNSFCAVPWRALSGLELGHLLRSY